MNENQSQMNWKELYGLFTDSLSFKGDNLIREDMYRYRREAALERQIASQQRQHEADQRRIAKLETEINYAKSLADIQDATTLSDWICGAQSEIANLEWRLSRQHERREQLDSWSDETPNRAAADEMYMSWLGGCQ